jgi:hypothetical protein
MRDKILTPIAWVIVASAVISFGGALAWVIHRALVNYTIPVTLVTLWFSCFFAIDYLDKKRHARFMEEEEILAADELIEF